jgi:hypothetical protein
MFFRAIRPAIPVCFASVMINSILISMEKSNRNEKCNHHRVDEEASRDRMDRAGRVLYPRTRR